MTRFLYICIVGSQAQNHYEHLFIIADEQCHVQYLDFHVYNNYCSYNNRNENTFINSCIIADLKDLRLSFNARGSTTYKKNKILNTYR